MKRYRMTCLTILAVGLMSAIIANAARAGLIIKSDKPLTSTEMVKDLDVNYHHPFVFYPADKSYKQAQIGDVLVMQVLPETVDNSKGAQELIAVVITPSDYKNFIDRNGKVIQPAYAPLVLMVDNQAVDTRLHVMLFDKGELTHALSHQGKNDRALQAWFVRSQRQTGTTEGPYGAVIRAVNIEYPR